MNSKRSLHVSDCIDLLRSALHALESGDFDRAETPMPLGYQDLVEIVGEKYDALMERRGAGITKGRTKRVKIRQKKSA